MEMNRTPVEQAEWDSESRLSGYCSVYSPVQDDEDAWAFAYDSARARGLSDDEAIDFADAQS